MTDNSDPIRSAAEICGIRLPVFQAGMAGLTGPALTAAVSNAGGLGHLGGLRLPPKQLRQWIRETCELTSSPFGVNIVPSFSGPEMFEAQVQVILEEKPAVLSLFYGDYPNVIRRARDAGIIVICQVGSLAEALKVWDEGAGIIVAQGIEAGGHVRGRLGLLPFLSSLRAHAAGRPVLAAGGIACAADVRTAIAAGASGVWVGTAFLATPESLAHPIYKQRVLDAGTDDTQFRTGYSYGWKYGTPHRVIPSGLRWNALDRMGGGARAWDADKLARKLPLYAGQGVGRINEIRPAAQIVAELAAGFKSADTNPAAAEYRSAHMTGGNHVAI